MGVLIGSGETDLGSALQTLANEGGAPIQGQHNTMHFSNRHEGLVLQLARFLRPIWSNRVVNGAALALNAPQDLQIVQGNLMGLLRYLNDTSYEGGHYPEHPQLWQAEDLSVDALRRLVKQANEAISFVLLLSDYKLPDILRNPR